MGPCARAASFAEAALALPLLCLFKCDAILLVLVLALSYVFAGENVAPVSDALLHDDGREALTAARNIAPVIRADYKGPRLQAKPRRVAHEYFQPRRLVVFGNFAAAAWAVHGQSKGAIQTITSRGLQGKSRCPYRPDYVFLCLGRGKLEEVEVDPRRTAVRIRQRRQGHENSVGPLPPEESPTPLDRLKRADRAPRVREC